MIRLTHPTRHPAHAALVTAVTLTLASRALAGGGGPDAGGYSWSDQAAGCAVRADAFGEGSERTFATNQWLLGPFELGFHFPFYDRVVTQAWVHSDGMLFFTPTYASYTLTNQPTPTFDGIDEGVVFASWDWQNAMAPSFWVQRLPGGEEWKLSFQGTLPFGGSSMVRHELYLHRDGDIRVEYLAPGDRGASATIGLESPDQTIGLQVLFDGSSPGGFDLSGAGPWSVCYTRSSGLDCASATPLPCGFTPGSLPAGAGSRVDAYGCGGGAFTGSERVYELRLSEPTDVSLLLTPAAGRRMGVFLLAGCTEHACLAGGGISASAPTLMAGTYRVVVDAATPADEATFSLVTTCAPLAQATACGTPTLGTTAGGRQLLDGYSCLWGDFSGPEAYHAVDHPGGPLSASVDSLDGKGAFIFRADQPLGATECLAGGVDGAAAHDAPAGRYLVVVDGPAGSAGAYALEVDCGPQVPCVPGAGALGCREIVPGTTIGAPSLTSFYACLPARYSGPEAAYEFTNDVEQVVSFVLDDATDPRLDLVLLDACDESACRAWGDREITRTLPPGTYRVVVDGRDAASAPFELTVACGLALEPALVEVTLAPGECFTEHETAWLTPTIPKLDVLFSIDASGSMQGEIAAIQQQVGGIMDAMDAFSGDVAFGLTSLVDYHSEETGTVPCSFVGPNYGRDTDYPYRLDQPITTDRSAVQSAADALFTLDGLDEAESYERALYEACADPLTGWRPDSRRVVVMFGDEMPHDCNPLECLGDQSWFSYGISFGRDGLANTPDDLVLLEVLDALDASDTTLVFMLSADGLVNTPGGSGGYRYHEVWGCLAERTGGSVARLDDTGRPLEEPDLAAAVAPRVQAAGTWCERLELRAEPGFEEWLQSATPVHADLRLPYVAEWDIEICAPASLPPGTHEFDVEVVCDGLVLGRQRVRAQSGGCAPQVAPPPADVATCRGQTATLDASGLSVAPCAGGVTHAWYDVGGAPVGTGPTLLVAPDTSTFYEVVATCASEPTCEARDTVLVTVEVPPGPFTAAATDPSDCSFGLLVGWQAADFGGQPQRYDVYRSEASCADALTAPPIAAGLRRRDFMDLTTTGGRAYCGGGGRPSASLDFGLGSPHVPERTLGSPRLVRLASGLPALPATQEDLRRMAGS